jgi:aspartyl-tRNA(Asn)/glutamyl-tRNA(Gln) amidotransferase subunit C
MTSIEETGIQVDVQKVAALSKIEIKSDEIEKYKFEVMQIFKMIKLLQKVEIDSNIEIHNFSDHSLPLRKDVVKEGKINDLVLSNTPKKEFECFTVPKVRE